MPGKWIVRRRLNARTQASCLGWHKADLVVQTRPRGDVAPAHVETALGLLMGSYRSS
jgi:hypothetical protein